MSPRTNKRTNWLTNEHEYEYEYDIEIRHRPLTVVVSEQRKNVVETHEELVVPDRVEHEQGQSGPRLRGPYTSTKRGKIIRI